VLEIGAESSLGESMICSAERAATNVRGTIIDRWRLRPQVTARTPVGYSAAILLGLSSPACAT
jgi:hypothetical protein